MNDEFKIELPDFSEDERKKKRAYSFYLNEENVEYLKKHYKKKAPLSKILDDILGIFVETVKSNEERKLEDKKSDTKKEEN